MNDDKLDEMITEAIFAQQWRLGTTAKTTKAVLARFYYVTALAEKYEKLLDANELAPLEQTLLALQHLCEAVDELRKRAPSTSLRLNSELSLADSAVSQLNLLLREAERDAREDTP